MIKVSNLSVTTQSGRNLLENVNFVVNDGDKMAIIGEEGNGKTTLIRTIFDKSLVQKDGFEIDGEIENTSGKIGYLRQFIEPGWDDFGVLDYFVYDNFDSEPNYQVYNDYNMISTYFSRLGLKKQLLESNQTIKTLSGGEKVKLQLAKLMYEKPDVLLLDEPTNDLDIPTLELLEKFINSQNSPVMFVSHDETLLEHTANCVLHLEQIKKKTQPRATFAKKSYLDYIEDRRFSLEKQDQIATAEQAERREQIRVTKEIKNKIQQANPGRTNSMRAVLARESRWEREEVTQHTDTEDSIRLEFRDSAQLANQKVVLDFKLDSLQLEDKTLAKNIQLQVVGPEKIVIIGNNGVGKTTLIKKIYDYFCETKPSNIQVGYMPQNYDDFLPNDESAITYLCEGESKERQELIRACLGRLKFTTDETKMKISQLSGGQKAKIYLSKLICSTNNVLLLDEPTRNLSPLSNPVIRECFRKYPGAIISVSHDRKFIDICDKVYTLDENGLKKKMNNEFSSKNERTKF